MDIRQEKIILSVLQNPDISVTRVGRVYHVEPYNLDFWANTPGAYRIDIDGQPFDYYNSRDEFAAPETTLMYETMANLLCNKYNDTHAR